MMDVWALVLMGIGLALIFALIGSRIQKGTKFVYPKDPFTLSLLIFLSIDMFMWILQTFNVAAPVIIPIEPYVFHIPIMMGYLLGYWLNGMQEVKQLKEIDEYGNEKSYYEVFYDNKEKKLCLAEQTNLGMLKRILFGIHHEIVIPGNLSFRDRESRQELRRPWWPKFKYDEIEILDRKPLGIVFVKKGFMSLKKYSTRLILADKYHVRPSVFKRNMSVLKEANIRLTEFYVENENLKILMDSATLEKASILNTDLKRYRPVRQFFEERERKIKEEELMEKQREAELAKAIETASVPEERKEKRFRRRNNAEQVQH